MVPDTFFCPTRRQWRFVCLVVVLAGSLLCPVLPAEAKSDYEIINTGIKGGGCWVDDNHFLVEKRVPRQGSQASDLEGLYLLNPRHPTDLDPISLVPLEPSAQKRVWQVSCQYGAITFLVPGSKKGSSRLYRLRIGEAPELIVEMRAPRVSLQGKYVLGNSHRAVMDGGPLQGVFEGNDDCLLADVNPGFKVLCWDSWLVIPQPLPQFVFSKYLWEESIKIREPNGQTKWVPNPEPPLKLPDGKEIRQGYLLRDLENHIVQEISTKQGIYRIDEMKPALNGTYLYATCSKAGDYDPPKTFFGRVCRFMLSDASGQWKEVFHVQKQPNERASLYDLDVNDLGDVVVLRRAYRESPALWKYTARNRSVVELRIPKLDQGVGAVRLAPDGRTISYVEKGHLTFVRVGGGKR
jgi:hypothetical protein